MTSRSRTASHEIGRIGASTWRCDNDYQYRSKRDETVDELSWRGLWCPRKATEATATRRLRYDDRGGPPAPEVDEEDGDEDSSSEEEEEEPVGDVAADAVAAAVAADAWHYLEMLRLENDEELKKLREEERQAELEDLGNIPAWRRRTCRISSAIRATGGGVAWSPSGTTTGFESAALIFKLHLSAPRSPSATSCSTRITRSWSPRTARICEGGRGTARSTRTTSRRRTALSARAARRPRAGLRARGRGLVLDVALLVAHHDARAAVHGGAESGPGAAREEGRGGGDVRLAGLL